MLQRLCPVGFVYSAEVAVVASAAAAAVLAAAVAAVELAQAGCPDGCAEGRSAEAGRLPGEARSRLWPLLKRRPLWQQATPEPPEYSTRSVSGTPMFFPLAPGLARVTSPEGRSVPRADPVPPALGPKRTEKWPCDAPVRLQGPERKSRLVEQVDANQSEGPERALLQVVVLLVLLDVLAIPPTFPPRSPSVGSLHPGCREDSSLVAPVGLVELRR